MGLKPDDFSALFVSEEVVPSVLLFVALRECLVDIETVRERSADIFIEKRAVRTLERLQSVLHQRLQGDRCDECPTDRRRHSAVASFTAWRTASPKRELKAARPPQPATSSSSAPGSRLEMSFE